MLTAMKVHTITFQFEDPSQKPQTFPATEGESILEIAMENGIQLHHNCGGVCACTTCHVYIEAGMENLAELSEKEEDYLDRAYNQKLNSRLGCQCVIAGDVVVTIPDQSMYLGS